MRTVVSYAYHENNRALYNLDFFTQVGISNDENILFIIVINGPSCSIELPKYNNVITIKRDNIGYDFGAHRASIDYLLNLYGNILYIPYDNFIFLNCGVIGPFLPSYYPSNVSWTNIFTSKLNDKVKLVGTSLVCFEYTAVIGKGPHVEGFCFCLDKIGLDIVMKVNTVFVNHDSKRNAVNNGEYGLSKTILNAGYNLDCLLYKYQNIDWTNKENWTNNNCYTFSSRNNTYDGISIHPFEVIFHKWFWAGHQPVNFNYVVKYRTWKLDDINKNKKIYATFGVGEYMINVTNTVIENFVSNNIVIIPPNYYDIDAFKRISSTLNSQMCFLKIYFKNVSYQIPHIIDNPIILYIDVTQFDIVAKYGCLDFNTDVSHQFINTFIKNDKIIIPEKYNFNKLFGDMCPKKQKNIFVSIKDRQYIINEVNNSEIKLDIN
jgi:hypothetical protein